MYKIGRFETNIILSKYVEIIVFMIDAFKINIHEIKIKTKKAKTVRIISFDKSNSYHNSVSIQFFDK